MKISRRDVIKLTTTASIGTVTGMAASLLQSCTNNEILSTNKSTNMKVLLINGSPHHQGCTYTALNEVAKPLKENNIETEIFWLGNKAISGCTACGSCRRNGKCAIDDEVNKCAEIATNTNGIVIGSPVHYAAASGFITPFMDRLFYSQSKLFAHKPGAAIVSCRRAGSTAALDQLNKYFTISNMFIVGSQYWNMVHGNTPDEVRQDLEGMQTMRSLGNNMAWILKSIEAGKKTGITSPKQEERVGTNFIR